MRKMETNELCTTDGHFWVIAWKRLIRVIIDAITNVQNICDLISQEGYNIGLIVIL